MEVQERETAERPRDEAAARLPRELRETGEAVGRARERLDEARSRFRDARRQASDSINRAGSAVRGYTRENPAASTLAAFGAGLAVGMLLSRRRSAAQGWRATVPAIAALADAVLEAFERRR